jgi:hypothetical protein
VLRLEQKIKFVYGLFNNVGDGIEHYWHFGVCLTEEEAYERWQNLLDSGFWIDQIEVI